MANEKEGQALREYGNRKKRYKRTRRAIIVFLLLIIIGMGIAYLITLYNRNYSNYGVLKTTEITGANAVGYLSYGSSIVKFSKDGATAIDKDGKQIWNGSYELSEPIADTCGKYVVIAGKDSTSIHIYNDKKEVGSFSTPYNIMKVQVAHQGVVAVLMEKDEGNYIALYDVDGTELTNVVTNTNDDGDPIDISLSDDGQKLVTSYLSFAGGSLIDRVTFYNFGEVGQNKINRIGGSFSYDEGIIIPRIEFINNDTVCAFKDNGISIFIVEELPKKPIQVNKEGKILSILYNSKHFGIVLKKEGTSSKQLLLYNLSGKLILNKSLDFDYEKIFLSQDDEIIMNDNMSCLIMKLDGRIKFKHTFDSNILALYPINNIDRYYLANESRLMTIQLEE